MTARDGGWSLPPSLRGALCCYCLAMRCLLLFVSVLLGPAAFASAQDVPADYKAVLSSLGKSGDFKDNVLKVNVPRNDLKVTIKGRSAPTPFGFGGWVALTKAA